MESAEQGAVESLLDFLKSIFHTPPSLSWHDDPHGVLHRLFWNEKPLDPSEGVWRTLGVVHLFASSGIHIYAFLAFVDRGVGLLLRSPVSLLGQDSSWIPRLKRGVWLFCVLIMLWAWALQEFRPGFARPMIIFLMRAWIKDQSVLFRLFAPLICTALIESLLDFGWGKLHYYFAIAGGIGASDLITAQYRKKGLVAPPVWKIHAAMAVGSWWSTAWIDVFESHRVSWMTPVYSVITIPIVSGFLYPVTLLSLWIEGRIPDSLLELWSIMMSGLEWISDHTPSPLTLNSATTNPMLLMLGMLLGLGVTWFRKSDTRRLSTQAFALSFALGARLLIPNTDQIVQFNVGQGDALIVKKGERIEMVDTGPSFAVKTSHWLDRLMYYEVRRIDTLLLTHLDQDHSGGLSFLDRLVPISCRVLGPNDSRSCFQTGEIAWFKSQSKRKTGNHLMAGVMIPLSKDSVYLALGDGDRSQEVQFEQRFREKFMNYSRRIWKIGHHGSLTSSDPHFIRRLDPVEVWLSVGKRNRYGHPHPQVMRTFWNFGAAKIRRTDQGEGFSADLIEKISQPSR